MAKIVWKKQLNLLEIKMFRNPINLDIKESGSDDLLTVIHPVTDSLLPNSAYLVRSNSPGLSFEIENPETELPLVTFDFEADR